VLLATRTVGGIFSTVVSIASLITNPALLNLGEVVEALVVGVGGVREVGRL